MHDAPAPPALVAALADRYRLEGPLGEGGSATVFLAVDIKHERRVAVKVLRPELAAALGPRRFLEEIRTTANLRHPHILPLFDSGEAAGYLYYVMPYIEGESLRDRLLRDGPLPVDETVALLTDIGAALSHAHAHGLVHRDVKPANVLLGDGGALVADFGVALALAGAAGDDRLTATGVSVGTPAYMSPEQVGGEDVDHRSDQFALACLAHEMLTGVPPFQAETFRGIVGKILTAPPPPIRATRPEVPESIEAAIRTALAKNPADRFASVAAFLDALRPAAISVAPRRSGRRMAMVAGVALVAVGWGTVVAWRAVQSSEARSALLDVAVLVDEGRYVEAYDRALEIERWIAGDARLDTLMFEVSDLLTITSEPPGASVWGERYDPAIEADGGNGTAGPPHPLGVTPIQGLRLPRATHRLMLQREGFAPVERLASTNLGREGETAENGRRLDLSVDLTPIDELPPGTVAVPGGPYRLSGPDAPPNTSADLEPFFLDRFEVSNAAFAEFIDAGGYEQDDLWPAVPSTLRATLVDRTGLPSPRGWLSQQAPDGEARHPVTGVTWFEARAFCRWSDKRLPTIFEWEKAARDGRTARMGVIMPWGVNSSTFSEGVQANFSSDGAVDVESFPFGISPYGAYAMAGNVREWLANPAGAGRVVTGGSWQGPSYVYSENAVHDPTFTSRELGFRCARSSGDGDQGGGALELDVPPPTWTPVDEATFQTLLRHYRYDPIPARARVSDVVETTAWTRERIWIDGAEGDSILVYVYRPKSAPPPHQTILYVTSSAAFGGMRVSEETEWVIGPAVRAGRAVVAPVLSGMTERPFRPGFTPPAPSTVAFRDLMVHHATEVRRTLDYAQTRSDLDPEAVAYVAFSFGAGSRLAFSAIDARYRAVVYFGGGIDERMKPTLPEADNVNFAPYVGVPKLMVHGANDEEHPWSTRGSPLWELLSEPKELVMVEGSGHLPVVEARIPALNGFLDRILGPVRRR